ncbi:glycosyltransferase family 2 protein [Thiomonas intermedia]|uniref:glycosyltransferase family 2 protein n=1 Tax=Thiomonas intermedia TaxID=926 RepID=UPI0009A4F40F|nr:glycosyltransferase family 2 protein [Thiomonas intermedia]
MNDSVKFSVIVITKNEANNITDCLQSVKMLADEIIVFDSGSTDGTQEICVSLGATVYETDWPGFGSQKNRALGQATGEWVLSIDADERLTPELAAEIKTVIRQHSSLHVYTLPRISSYCGQFMRYGGWYPDRVARLFRRGSAQFSNDIVHESLITDASLGALHNPLLHISYRSLDEVLEKINFYSSAGAEKLAKSGRKTSLTAAIARGFWAFIRTYFLKLGFLDGKLGLLLAISNAEGTYYKYIKLWLISQQEIRDGQ